MQLKTFHNQTVEENTMRDYRIQKLCAWSGVATFLLFFGAFGAAKFVLPPGPWLTQEQVVAMYQQNTTEIRIGMSMALISCMFFAPFVGVISAQMRRMEGMGPTLSYTQMAAGGGGVAAFFFGAVIFLVTAFRPDRPPELTYLMNDFSWIGLIIIWPPFFMQQIAVGIAIIKDTRAKPVMPRWVAYLSFWTAISYLPTTMLSFFKAGPFAWNGVLALYIPSACFISWYVVMAVMLSKAVDQQKLEAASA